MSYFETVAAVATVAMPVLGVMTWVLARVLDGIKARLDRIDIRMSNSSRASKATCVDAEQEARLSALTDRLEACIATSQADGAAGRTQSGARRAARAAAGAA